MKITRISKYILAASLFVGVVACESPMKDFNLQISTSVIQHSAVVKIVDVNGNAVAGATVKLESGQTSEVYNMDGKKSFKVVDGQVEFGLSPNVRLTGTEEVRFRIQVEAPGYNSQITPVTISTNSSTGITVVTMMKPSAPVDGLEETQVVVELAADGSTISPVTVALPAGAPGEAAMSLNIPAGTQFRDANGNIIKGGALTISMGSFDSDNDDVKALLPGGGLTADGVVLAGGRTAPGTFSAAGITRIVMVINGVTITQFSNPISVGIPVPKDYVSPINNQAIAAGQTFDLFSNSARDNTWRYEKTVTISGTAATGYIANFTTDHLTFFMVAEFGEACATGATVNFSGDWMDNGFTFPVTVEAVWGGDLIFKRVYSINSDNKSILIDGLPDGTKLTFKNAAGNVLGQTTLATCGQVTNVVLPNPGDAVNKASTLQLYVRCPDKDVTITLLPTFHMHYRVAGTGQYKFLGTVTNGLLRTSLLKTDGTKYDFKAYYKTHVKTVTGRSIQEDNSATVGLKPGDIIGEKVGATNLAILKEECKNL